MSDGGFQDKFWRSAPRLEEKKGALSSREFSGTEFALLAENLPTLCWIANGDGYIVWYNRRWHEYTGTTAEEMEGWGWQSVHDPERLPAVMERWTASIASGEPFEMTFPLRGADGIFRPFLTRIQPVRDATGEVVRWYGVNTEISAQVAAEREVGHSGERFRQVFENAAVGMIEINSEWKILRSNEAYREITGRPEEELQGSNCLSFTHPEDVPICEEALQEITNDETSRITIEKRYVRPEGGVIWVRSSISRVSSEESDMRFLKVVEDITEVRQAREALREESEALEILNRTAAEVAAELDLDRLVQTVTDAGVQLTGATFGAFFYTTVDEAGESLLLYALSGADRSQFDGFGHPRPTPIFAPTFKGEGVIRSDDITKDPRYGQNAPNKGMPEGHLPVRSYLAVPVTSRSGEVIGGLFFGHPEPQVFDESSERLMLGLAAQAATGIDNSRLYENVQRANQTLEERVAERSKELELAHETLRQAQKMEAIGQLTGGIAHDFNNLLAGISGSLEVVERRISQGRLNGIDKFIQGAQASAQRAAALTQRLLAFSRRQNLDPQPTDINRLIHGMEDLIRGTAGHSIKLEIVGAVGLWPACVDAAQLESALLNLCINARDAMPSGGRMTIETANKWIDERAGEERELPPGQYISVCVSDTGTGIEEDIVDRIFDPFFTTKPIGQGTGLGLSMIHGFVRQSGGQVRVYSEPGEGTTMCLYLPRYAGEVGDESEAELATIHETGAGQSVLVIDDEPIVRMLMVEVLEEAGYRALQAEDGPSGLKILQSDAPIDLLITDVGLPGGMNGRQVADAARIKRPDLKVLFVTGFAENAAVASGHLEPGMAVVTKPFVMAELADKITDMIEKP